MKLNKRYVRSVKENRSFYIASSVLTIVSLLMFYLFNIAGSGILNFSDDFFSDNKLEDANFSTYMPISEDIEWIRDEYDVTLEAQHYFNLINDDTTARVFERTEEIDLYEITGGKDVSSDDEVIISEGYAENMGVNIGDKIAVGEKEYTVSGYFQRPDYLYMLQNADDSYKNISTFFLCYLSDSEFESLGEANCQYLVKFNEENSREFREYIHENYVLQDYLAAEENQRICMVDDQANLFIIMSYALLVVLPLIAVALVSIIISRKVKSEQKLIGTLTALGYTKKQLMKHYAGFAAIPGILGGVLSAVVCTICAQSFGEMGLADYEPMKVKFSLNPLVALIGVVIPTLMYVIAALLSVRKLLKQDTVLLLSGNAGGKKKLKHMLAGKKMSFRKKFAIRQILGNPARTLVIFMGIFVGSYIMLFGLGFFDTMKSVADNSSDRLGSFEYEYILNELLTEETYGGEPILASSLETEEGSSMSLIGTDSDNKYLDLQDENGNQINVDEGYYLTSLSAMLLEVEAGDELTLYNPLSMEEIKIKVAGIIDNDMQKAVYTSKEQAAELIGVEDDAYNALMSAEKLDIPKEKLVKTITKSDMSEQFNTIFEEMEFMLYILVILGVIICVSAIYVAVNMLVTESRGNISMLKVLGYDDKKINQIVLRINHILLPIGIALSIPAVFITGNAIFKIYADTEGMLMTMDIAIKSYVIAILLTVLSYFGSLAMIQRKVKKVSMVESLKDNRE